MAKDKKDRELRTPAGVGAGLAPARPPAPPEDDFYETPYIIGIVVFFALMVLLLWHQGFFSSK